jgi:hypothetical protein
MEQGQRVMWKENGDLGTVKWVTRRGGFFAVDWDNGSYVEYADNSVSDIIIVEEQ